MNEHQIISLSVFPNKDYPSSYLLMQKWTAKLSWLLDIWQLNVTTPGDDLHKQLIKDIDEFIICPLNNQSAWKWQRYYGKSCKSITTCNNLCNSSLAGNWHQTDTQWEDLIFMEAFYLQHISHIQHKMVRKKLLCQVKKRNVTVAMQKLGICAII